MCSVCRDHLERHKFAMQPTGEAEAVQCINCNKSDHFSCMTAFSQNCLLFDGFHKCFECTDRYFTDEDPLLDW